MRPKRNKKTDLGNTQCGVCLNIFPVRGELPQTVNCPRCGVEMLLEWKKEADAPAPEAEKG